MGGRVEEGKGGCLQRFLFRTPEITFKVDFIAGVKLDPFTLEKVVLQKVSLSIVSLADFPPGVNNPLPRNVTSGGESGQGKTDSSGRAANLSGNLSIGGNAPGRDQADKTVDCRIKGTTLFCGEMTHRDDGILGSKVFLFW